MNVMLKQKRYYRVAARPEKTTDKIVEPNALTDDGWINLAAETWHEASQWASQWVTKQDLISGALIANTFVSGTSVANYNGWLNFNITGTTGGAYGRGSTISGGTNGGIYSTSRIVLSRPAPKNHRGNSLRAYFEAESFKNVRPEEITALQLLRQMISQEDFRRYLKHGFVTVEGPSDVEYQIWRNQVKRINVKQRGVLIATLCIHLAEWNNKPPTDEVVAKLLIAQYDEMDLWRRSNIAWHNRHAVPELHAQLVAAGVVKMDNVVLVGGLAIPTDYGVVQRRAG